MTKPSQIAIPDDLLDALHREAERAGVPVEQVLREAIEGQLSGQGRADLAVRETGEGFDWDGRLDISEDEARLAAFRSRGEGLAWADVRDWLQSLAGPAPLPRPQPHKLV